MTGREIVLGVMRELGRADARSLRNRAADMDGTAIIAEGAKIPPFDPAKDYSGWPMGGPVTDGGQVWTLLQPHKDPAKAKPFVAPCGTSGMYMAGECVLEDGIVFRCLVDNTVYSPDEFPGAWVQIC